MQIYAIDISKEYLDVFSKSGNGNCFQKRIKNNFGSICKLLLKMEPDDFICAEYTGVYGGLLIHLAYANQIKIALVPGFDIKHSLGNRKGKSDQIDAERIWEYACRFQDRLTFDTPDGEGMAEIKTLFAFRNQLVKALKTFSTSATMLKQNPYRSIAEYRLREQAILFMQDQIRQTEKQIFEIIEQSAELLENFNLVTSITGIGKVTALELIISTGNFKRINSARKAAAYAGVCPYPNQSGGTAKKSRVHFRANKHLKSLLHICSKSICVYNKEFQLYRQRKMMEGKHFYLVMNNVANKLLRIVFAVIQSGKPFDLAYINHDPRISADL